VQSDQSQRLRWIAGVISQQQLHDYDLRWLMNGIAPGLSVIGSNVQYLTQQERNDDEIAAFGEITYDLTGKLAATVGARAFETDNSLEGFTGSAYWPSTPPRTCDPDTGICDVVKNLDVEAEEKDQTYRVNLSYRIDDDRMVYATWSEGFRPGGGNRQAAPPFDTYEADFVENWELGWKTTWLDNRVRLNGAVFYLEWTDFQYSVSADPDTIGPLPIVINAGESESRGIEFDLSWLPIENVTISAAGAFTDAEMSEDLDLSVVGRGSDQVSVEQGTEMPFVPKYQGNIIVRYDLPVTQYEPYVQLAWTYTDSSYNGLEEDREKQASYDIANFAAGIAYDNWTLDFFADNLTDERAEIYKNAVEYDHRVTTNKPRSFGVRFAQRF
jgi:iron complex outermembrane receptor protein